MGNTRLTKDPRESLFGKRQWKVLADALHLSPRELDLLACLCDDLTEVGIARELHISRHTVRTHFERLYRKLGVRSRSGLLIRVFRAHLKCQGVDREAPGFSPRVVEAPNNA